jgi:putative membrane protein
MSPGTRKIFRFIGSWIINTLAVFVTVEILHDHISYGDKIGNLLIASLLLGILNAFVRPILMLIALPLVVYTLGLFMFVINALLLEFLSLLLPFFHVDSFGYAFLGALIISAFSLFLHILTGMSKITVTRQRPPDDRRGGGDGPVIDV